MNPRKANRGDEIRFWGMYWAVVSTRPNPNDGWKGWEYDMENGWILVDTDFTDADVRRAQ